jgi:hypothetical protein
MAIQSVLQGLPFIETPEGIHLSVFVRRGGEGEGMHALKQILCIRYFCLAWRREGGGKGVGLVIEVTVDWATLVADFD